MGILLHKALSWSGHITNILLRYLIFKKKSESFPLPYISSSYYGICWDPYQLNDIQALEKVQRRAARWVMKDYSRYVSAMLHRLNWPPLQVRCRIGRLQTLYSTIYYISLHTNTKTYVPDTTTHFTSSPVQELAPISTLFT